jgi:hypothetical protein
MKAYQGVEVKLHVFSTSAEDGGVQARSLYSQGKSRRLGVLQSRSGRCEK